MSDITYARKADELTQVDPDDLRDPERLALALVHATQGVARANREIDGKLKYVADQIARAVRPDEKPERWISWGDPGDRRSVAVSYVLKFEEYIPAEGITDLPYAAGTVLHLSNGEIIHTSVSYGTIAMMVGA